MDSGDMSSHEMRQAQSNFPESPDLAAGCQNFFPRESFGLPDPVAADKCLYGQTNKQGRENGKEGGGKLGAVYGVQLYQDLLPARFPGSGPVSSPLRWLMLLGVVCGYVRRTDFFIPSSPSNFSVLHSGGREQRWEG